MKRVICILLVLIVLSGCQKEIDPQAQALIERIDAIGEVTLDDGHLIGEIEDAYAEMSEDIRKQVSNLDVLKEARAKYDEIQMSHPIPYSELNWTSTAEDMRAAYGKEKDANKLDDGGSSYTYQTTFHGEKGKILYVFDSAGLLRGATFIYDGSSEAAMQSYFETLREEFETLYGTIASAKENKVNDSSYINFYTWYTPVGTLDLSVENMVLSGLAVHDVTMRMFREE